MRLMSCKRAEKLMPLYAAGDLPPGWRTRAVAAHVARCASCAALAEEFRASREWVRAAGEAPEFGDDFYERLRAGVLDEISRDTRPVAPGRFAPLFAATFARPRFAYAASLALAACALALSFYGFRGAEKSPAHQALDETTPRGGIGRATPGHSPVPTPRDATNDGQQLAQPKDKMTGGSFKRTPSLRRTSPAEGRAPELAAAVVTPLAQQVVRQENVPTPALREGPISVARIEIQTADPNIRIIWLAPDTSEETEPDRVDPER